MTQVRSSAETYRSYSGPSAWLHTWPPRPRLRPRLAWNIPTPGASGINAGRSQPPSLLDLEAVAADIKNTVTTAIADLKTEIYAVAHRLDGVEQVSQTHTTAIRQVQTSFDSHLSQLLLEIQNFPAGNPTCQKYTVSMEIPVRSFSIC